MVLDGQLDFSRPAAEPVHLADLETDPGEYTNLAAEQPELVQQFRALATAWRAEVRPAV